MLKNSGFTLVELSIAIVIIGLVVSGVLGGRSLIESAQRQSLYKNVKSYETAIQAFRLEYDDLPGDFDEAQDYWGVSVDNGDGDKLVEAFNELVDVWEHLSKAEIVTGEFSGSGTTYSRSTMPYNEDYGFYYEAAHPAWLATNYASSWMGPYYGSLI